MPTELQQLQAELKRKNRSYETLSKKYASAMKRMCMLEQDIDDGLKIDLEKDVLINQVASILEEVQKDTFNILFEYMKQNDIDKLKLAIKKLRGN